MPDARQTLEWYAEKVSACRKLTREGEEARHALDADGGKRARIALMALSEEREAASPIGAGVMSDGRSREQFLKDMSAPTGKDAEPEGGRP